MRVLQLRSVGVAPGALWRLGCLRAQPAPEHLSDPPSEQAAVRKAQALLPVGRCDACRPRVRWGWRHPCPATVAASNSSDDDHYIPRPNRCTPLCQPGPCLLSTWLLLVRAVCFRGRSVPLLACVHRLHCCGCRSGLAVAISHVKDLPLFPAHIPGHRTSLTYTIMSSWPLS